MSGAAAQERGRGWLLQNMQLLGLDNTDRGHSLFVCVKELFENAIDACARRDGGVHPMARESVVAHRIAPLVQIRAIDKGDLDPVTAHPPPRGLLSNLPEWTPPQSERLSEPCHSEPCQRKPCRSFRIRIGNPKN